MAKKKTENKSNEDITSSQKYYNLIELISLNFTKVFDLTKYPELKKSLEENDGVPTNESEVQAYEEIVKEQFPKIIEDAVLMLEFLDKNFPNDRDKIIDDIEKYNALASKYIRSTYGK